MILESILGAIGKTPLIPLTRIGARLDCNLYAKCEFLNPGGSVKDRIAIRMIEEAERTGKIKPGDTLIEPTSGNTGIGLALAGAVKGYDVIITMPEKMSREKQVILESLGARIIRTPTEAAWDAPESHISVAKKLQKQLPNAHILDQYANPANPDAHYYGTAQEILDDLDHNVHMVVMGAGTGGTISGVARRIKEACPDCLIIGADPVGSVLADDGDVGTYKVEGIGYDFVPEVLDRKLVDRWVKTQDRQSFLLARELIRDEGLLCGGSSGAALFAALHEAKSLRKNENCVVLLPDGIRNYLSKFVDDKWMQDHHFLATDAPEGSVRDFAGCLNQSPPVCLDINDDAYQAIKIMRENGFSQIPVTKEQVLAGMLHENDLLNYMLSGQYQQDSIRCGDVMSRKIPSVNEETPLAAVHELLSTSDYVIVIDRQRRPVHILTKIDLVEWFVQNPR
ncbi:MAG: cystathionine beta-synthase [Deltaproteobacteria bacterium]|nr:cystathionine beta-synthase [Deltaproteobacteria bacterium]